MGCDCFELFPAESNSSPAQAARGPGHSRERGTAGRLRFRAIDVHAHPGRCFLEGVGPDDGLAKALGGADSAVAMQAMRDVGMGAVAFSTVSDLRVLGVGDDGGLRAIRPFAAGEAYEDHLRQVAGIRALADEQGARLVLEPGDLTSSELGVLLSCEGGDFLEGWVDRVEEASRAGVRMVTLVHYRVNELGDIQTEAEVHGGLTEFGRSVVREMNRWGMVIDLAHATEAVTRGVLAVSEHPVVISHSHLARGAGSHPRLLSLGHARSVAEAGGLVGAWPAGVSLASFDDYVEEILRMVDALGVEHVAIGTDMDANFRPVLTDYAEFPRLEERLTERGLGDHELALVLGGNFERIFRAVRA